METLIYLAVLLALSVFLFKSYRRMSAALKAKQIQEKRNKDNFWATQQFFEE